MDGATSGTRKINKIFLPDPRIEPRTPACQASGLATWPNGQVTNDNLSFKVVAKVHKMTMLRYIGSKQNQRACVKPKFFYELENRNPPLLQLNEVPQQLDEVAQVPQNDFIDIPIPDPCLPNICLPVNSFSGRRRNKKNSLSRKNEILKNKIIRLQKKIKTLNQKINRDKKRVIKLTEKDLIIGASNYIYGRNLDFF
ncbi:hypothetical protein TKK_0005561 [Trichogramma kaykai]